jgi:hypothetical protein
MFQGDNLKWFYIPECIEIMKMVQNISNDAARNVNFTAVIQDFM